MKKLYIKQKVFKITDHYEVFDDNQIAVYRVDQDFKFWGNAINVTKLNGSGSFTIKRGIVFFLANYDVDFSDGKNFNIKQDFAFFRKKLKIISDDYDLNLLGDLFSFDFNVYNGDKLVGNIYRKVLTWRDTFVIEVIDENFEDELLALLIAIDDLIDIDESR
ncbi:MULTISPECIES: LURP-one-related/scramblase family protein [Helcococcus]|uniref:LURP-one-related family protein n=1 Tax=Helcococcus bovis TaxID=3153252 RepID=A0ABW9F6C4_9FIRM